MSEEIENMIDAIATKDFNAAGNTFSDLIGQKVQAALDDQKIAIANRIYNGSEEQMELDLDDDELEIDTEGEDDDEEVEES